MDSDEPTGFYDYLPRGSGMIRRRAYTRKSGVTVRAKYIKDMGARGKWRVANYGAPGIGPLKKGELINVGYSVTKTAKARHAAVKRAVSKYGRNSTVRKLNAVSVYTRRTSPAKSKKFKSDMKFAQKMKGGNMELEDFKSRISDKLNEDETAPISAEMKKEAESYGIRTGSLKTIDDLYGAVKNALMGRF